MSKNKEQSLNIITQKFGNIEEKNRFKGLSLALEESIKEISSAEYGLVLMFDSLSKQIEILNKNITFNLINTKSILQTVLFSKKPIFENFVVSHKKYNQKIDNPLNIDIKSTITIPILNIEKTEVIGFIQAINSVNSSVKFGRYDLRILNLLDSYARKTFEQSSYRSVENSSLSTPHISKPTPQKERVLKPIILHKAICRKTKNELKAELKEYEEKIEILKKELNSKEQIASKLEESLSIKTQELNNSQKKIAKYELISLEENLKKEEKEKLDELKIILDFLTNEVNYLLKGKDKIYLFLKIIKNSLHNQKKLLTIDKELKETQFLNSLVESIFTIEKVPLIKETFNIFQTISEVTNLYSHEFSNKDITFNVFIDPRSPNWVITDEEKIKSLMVHLLNNLYGVVDSGGAIEVLVGYSSLSKSIILNIKGLFPNKLKEIKRLFKNKKVSHGLTTSSSGVGLSICNNLIAILGAKLKVTTIKGDEYSFKIDIPIKIDRKSINKILPYENPKKVGILMDDSNLFAYLNIKRYLLSLNIKNENILLFKNNKKINSRSFSHLFCFENMLSKHFDMSIFNSISILKYSSEISQNDYGRGIDVNELYINSYYGMEVQKILFPDIPVENITPKTLLVKDSFFNRVVNKLLY